MQKPPCYDVTEYVDLHPIHNKYDNTKKISFSFRSI